jgi:haloacetate dehalogenase
MMAGFTRLERAPAGVRLHARVGGSGPPLLLLHGHPQSGVMWHRVAPRLAPRFTVVCADLRGCGDSNACRPTPATRRTASARWRSMCSA